MSLATVQMTSVASAGGSGERVSQLKSSADSDGSTAFEGDAAAARGDEGVIDTDMEGEADAVTKKTADNAEADGETDTDAGDGETDGDTGDGVNDGDVDADIDTDADHEGETGEREADEAVADADRDRDGECDGDRDWDRE